MERERVIFCRVDASTEIEKEREKDREREKREREKVIKRERGR